MGILGREPLVLGGLSVVSLLATVAFQFMLVGRVGLGVPIDVFVASASLSQILSSLVLTVMPAVLVPALSNTGPGERYPLVVNVLITSTPVLCLVALALSIAARPWGAVVFDAFSEESLAAFVALQKIHALAIPASAVTALGGSLLHAKGLFRANAKILAFFSVLAALLLAVFGCGTDLIRAAWIQNGCLLAQAFTMLGLASRGERLKHFRFLPNAMGRLCRKAGPLFGGAAYGRMEILVDRHILLRGEAGEMAIFALVRQVLEAGAGLLARTHIATVVPILAQTAGAGESSRFSAIYLVRKSQVMWLASGLLFFTWTGAALVVNFPDFALPESAPADVLALIPLLSGVLVFSATGGLAASAFYALGDTRTPTIVGVLGFTFFAALKLWIHPRFGVLGVALASSAYFATNSVTLGLFLRRRLKQGIN